jgi:hypothetical protein
MKPATGLSEEPMTAEVSPVGDPNPVSAKKNVHTGSPGAPVIGDDAWGAVVGADLSDVAAVCDIRANGCWLAPTNKSIRCRSNNDGRGVLDLPKMALHRWAWMVDNGLTQQPIPTYLVQIRRRCTGTTCCNPTHLYAASPGGQELTRIEVACLVMTAGAQAAETATDGNENTTNHAARIVLLNDLGSISDYCSIDDAGCWIAPTGSPVPCRAKGDERADQDLPQLAFHRWMWMVVHGRSSNPLPGNMFHVRRHCGNSRCCNPDHLYLTRADGQITSLREAEMWLGWEPTGRQDDRIADFMDRHRTDAPHDGWRTVNPSHHPTTTGGRHRASASDDASRRTGYGADQTAPSIGVFADRLNELFENHRQPDGAPFTSAEVAAALQEDSLPVSENLIARLRAASGDLPNVQTTEALAYFFNVDIDHFSTEPHSTPDGCRIAANVGRHATIARESTSSVPPTSRVQVIPLSVADLGRIAAGLSEAASECLARRPAEVERARSLLSLLAGVGEILSTPRDSCAISRPLLQRVIAEWTSAGDVTSRRQPFVTRLSALVDGP